MTYVKPGGSSAFVTELISVGFYGLAAYTALTLVPSPSKIDIIVLKHIYHIKNQHLKELIIHYFKENPESLISLSKKELIALLPECALLTSEIAEVLLKKGVTAFECSTLVKRIDHMSIEVKEKLIKYVTNKSSNSNNDIETLLYKKLNDNFKSVVASNNDKEPSPISCSDAESLDTHPTSGESKFLLAQNSSSSSSASLYGHDAANIIGEIHDSASQEL